MTGKNNLLMLRRTLLDGTLRALHLDHGAHNPADSLSKPTYAPPARNTALNVALSTGLLRPLFRAHTKLDSYGNAPRLLTKAERRLPRPMPPPVYEGGVCFPNGRSSPSSPDLPTPSSLPRVFPCSRRNEIYLAVVPPPSFLPRPGSVER